MRVGLSFCAAVFVLGSFGAKAAELPVYEVSGFPISPHQLATLGPSGAEEQIASGQSTLYGMPASPHQIAVLSPRRRAGETVAAVTARAGAHR